MKGDFKNKFKNIFSGLNGKKLASTANTAFLIAAVVAIAVIVNLLLEFFPMNIDLTTEKLYSLTDTTKTVLKDLEGEVTIYALYDRLEGEESTDSSTAQVIKVLDLYDKFDKVSVEYVDLDRKPAFLKNTVGEANAAEYSKGDYIVKHGDNFRQVKSDELVSTETQSYYYQEYVISTGLQAETKFTSAILKVFSDVPIVYYSTGFGEAPISNFQVVKTYIEGSGFDVKPIDLKSEDFDEKAVSIIFFGPTNDLSGEAEHKLGRWLDYGGDAFFFMDITEMDAGDAIIYNKFENFSKVFDEYGIALGDAIVEEGEDNRVMAMGTMEIFSSKTSSVGALAELPSKNFYFYNSRNIIVDDMKHQKATAFITTSADAVAKSVNEEGRTVSGKQVIGASSEVEIGVETSRITVFGSSYAVSDTMISQFNTGNVTSIFSSIMKWMDLEIAPNVGDDIETKKYNDMVSTYVEVSEKEIKTIVAIVIIIIPVIILAIGVIIWLRRRHL